VLLLYSFIAFRFYSVHYETRSPELLRSDLVDRCGSARTVRFDLRRKKSEDSSPRWPALRPLPGPPPTPLHLHGLVTSTAVRLLGPEGPARSDTDSAVTSDKAQRPRESLWIRKGSGVGSQ
jgi:hypothetical protein